MATFDLNQRTKRTVATILAVGVVGAGAAGGIAAATGGNNSPTPSSARAPAGLAAEKRSTVPASVKRAETAAEDVITFLEKGKPAKSRAEAKLLKQLARGKVAAELKRAGVSQSKISELQRRADRVQRLSAAGASKLRVSLAANSVSQLMPGFYARYQDPVPPAVLRLDYLDRQIQLRSMAGQTGHVKRLVKAEGATWSKLRPQLVKAGGTKVARQYDAHLRALKHDRSPAAIQKQAVTGLDIVDLMEKAFLGK